MSVNRSLLTWCQRQRQEWIAETLRVFGFINRDHLRRKFGVSTPQASTDLKLFQKLNFGVMYYDRKAKRYVATEWNGDVF